jgi:transcriptional repressor NrdR
VRCPFCGYLEDKVVDSRLVREGRVIRRRRRCEECSRRYTTYEQIEDSTPVIVKKDGRRQAYDRQKLMLGIVTACQKRPVPTASIEGGVDQIESDLFGGSSREISADALGEAVMSFLKGADPIAYVRFASVYRSYSDLGQFLDEINEMIDRDPPGE